MNVVLDRYFTLILVIICLLAGMFGLGLIGISHGLFSHPCEYDPSSHVHYIDGTWYNDEYETTGFSPTEDSNLTCPPFVA